MGNYSAGDYYRGGDNYAAGGLSLKGLVKGIGKIALGAAKLTPIGRAVTTAVDVLSTPARRPSTGLSISPIAAANIEAGVVPDVDYPGTPAAMIPSLSNQYIYDERGRRKGDTGRKGHFKKDGTWTNRARPRMNPGNMRALRRASRRAHAFLRATRSAVRYFVPKAKPGKAYVSFRKRAK